MKIQVTPAQRSVLLSPARFIFMGAGRRFGKTYTAEARLKYKAATQPGWYAMFLTPVISQNEESFENILSDEEFAPFIRKTRTRPGKIWLFNGSRIDFRSMQVSRHIRGRGLIEVWIDESQDVDPDDYQRIIRPTISDRRGNIILSGQFRGHDWRYKDFFEPGLHPPGSKENPIVSGRPLYQSFRFPSSAGIKFQGEEGRLELELARQQLPKYVFETEYEALIVDNPQSVFSAEQLARITHGETRNEPERAEYGPPPVYVIGCDVGKVCDPTAVVVMDAKTGHVVYSERFPLGLEHAASAFRVANLSRKWRNASVILDSTGGATGGHYPIDSFVRLYKEACPHIRPMWLNPTVKTDLINALVLAVQQGQLSIPPRCTELLDELKAYEWEKKGSNYSFHGPKGHADDLVIALALAHWGVARNWINANGTSPAVLIG